MLIRLVTTRGSDHRTCNALLQQFSICRVICGVVMFLKIQTENSFSENACLDMPWQRVLDINNLTPHRIPVFSVVCVSSGMFL